MMYIYFRITKDCFSCSLFWATKTVNEKHNLKINFTSKYKTAWKAIYVNSLKKNNFVFLLETYGGQKSYFY